MLRNAFIYHFMRIGTFTPHIIVPGKCCFIKIFFVCHFYTPMLHSVIPPRIITTINIAYKLFILIYLFLFLSSNYSLIELDTLFMFSSIFPLIKLLPIIILFAPLFILSFGSQILF